MKSIRKPTTASRWAQVGMSLALACLASNARAIDDRIIGNFDTDIDVADGSYGQWPDGSSDKTLEWSNEDADGNAQSGSLKVTVNWNGTQPGWNDSKVAFKDATGSDFAWPGIDCRSYINLEWDVKVDVANSFPAQDGSYGLIQVVCQGWEGANGNPAGLGWVTLGSNLTITNMSGWQHMKMSLTGYPYNLNKLVLSLVVNPGTNRIVYLFDNVKLTAPPQPPPTLTTEKAVPGLAFIAASQGQWDRQNIRTVGTDYSWMGRPGAVSYSVDIAQHAVVDGFRFHLFLVPGISDPNRADSDWHETNCLMTAISSNPDGGAWTTVNCKVNAPDANGRQFEDVATGGGNLGGFGAARAAGTWTLTISQDATLTVIAPDGSGLTNTIPAAIMDVWKTYSTMQFAVGVMPGNSAYVGQKTTITRVKTTGLAQDLDANFLANPLDTNIWSIVASSATLGVQQIPVDAKLWVNWTLPANGFRLQASPTMAADTWKSLPISGFIAGDNHFMLLRQDDLPYALAGFFRLIKTDYSKLLILLPGETAAPGTPTGKTGTPTPAPIGQGFDFIVKAVDLEWYPISGVNNNIRITCTDPNAQVDWTFLPLDVALANGVYTPSASSCILNTAGTHTFKVEDTTDPTKTAYTSAPVEVQ